MTPLSNSSPEVLAALLGACVKTGCYPAALLRIDEGRQLVELIAPAVDFEGRSISYRADATTRAIRAACASYRPREEVLIELLQLGEDRDRNLTERRANVAELSSADSGDSIRKKEKEWLFDLSVELMIMQERGDAA